MDDWVEKEHPGDWKKMMVNYGTEKAQTMEILYKKTELVNAMAWKKKERGQDIDQITTLLWQMF